MAIRTVYRPGDFLRDCDRCGFTVYASETRKQWDGLIVCIDGCFEERHPQDFVRGRVDRQNVPDPRPPGASRFVGPLSAVTTAEAPAGQSFLLLDTTGMTGGDTLQVIMSDGNVARATILTVTSAVRIDLVAGLPGAVAEGATVTDVSAVTAADIG